MNTYPSPEPGFQLSPIKAMELAASKIPGAISLAQGIPSFNTPLEMREFVIERIRQGACDKYSLTTGLAELREEIASNLAQDGLQYDPDSEIIVTAGSIEGITAALLSVTKPGDEVLLPSPSYASYSGSVYLSRCTPRFFALDEDNNFDFHIENIRQALTRKTRAILYCSPNNPTGTLFSEQQTRELLALAEKHDLAIIIDEVYKDFYYTDDIHFSPVSLSQARARVIRVCSFSKSYAMTGWRVGFLHADKSLVQPIVKFHDAMVTCAPVASQYGAIAALRFGQKYVAEFREEFRRRRNYVLHTLDGLSHVLDYQTPKAAYFVFPRIKDSAPLARDSHKLAYDILHKVGVAVVPGVAFGPSGESHLRITFGRNRADVEQAMERLASYFSKTQKSQAELPQPAAMLREPGLRRAMAASFLALCSRLYLWRTAPMLIGIAGSLGKTAIKRALVDALRRRYSVRANVLSYNTEIGLPLSVLGLQPPASRWQHMTFPFRVLVRALSGKGSIDIMVLEYGIRSTSDAESLLRVAVPRWLIVSDIATSDPGFSSRDVHAGVKLLASRVDPTRILWAGEDEWTRTVRPDLNPELELREDKANQNSTAISRSAKLGLAAAEILIARL